MPARSQTPSRGTNPLRLAATDEPTGARDHRRAARPSKPTSAVRGAVPPAAARHSAQLPAIAPFLDEFELSGWSSHRRSLRGNFHDWLMLEGRTILAVAGHAIGPDPLDATEAALVAQAAWATIRAHAAHTLDAGELLTLASRSLWRVGDSSVQASVVVVLLDTLEGHATLAMAGDCLAWRVRAATIEQLTARQPALGGAASFSYASDFVQLALRERLLLMADNPARRRPKLTASVARSFARLDAESHRRMMAADALRLVRDHTQQKKGDSTTPSASIVAVRRR